MNRRDEPGAATEPANWGVAGHAVAWWLLGIGALAPGLGDAQGLSGNWQFAATAYLWLPDIGSHSTFPADDGTPIDVDAGAILDLRAVGMGSFSVQKQRWGAYTDLIYLDLGASKSGTRNILVGGQPLPASVSAATDFDFRATAWTTGGSYRVMANPEGILDVFAGARLLRFRQVLEWEFTGDFGQSSPPPRTGRGEDAVDQWDAIVGVKGQLAFGADRQWVVPYYFDIGTGDSDLTWQGMLGFGRAFGWGDLSVAWRYLDYDLQPGGSLASVSFNGPALGFTFHW